MKSLKSRFPLYKENVLKRGSSTMETMFTTTLLNPAEQQTAKILIKKDFQQLQDEQGIQTQEEEAEDEKPDPEEMSLWWAVLEMAQPAHRKPTTNVEKIKYLRLVQNGAKYPLVLATSVASEQLFSSVGNTVTFMRTLLSPEHIEQLCFLHDRLK
ncbi:hypothetical protein PR048_013834 [Dryococelus australis]|uniref:HAT C-terminal dimerisation domain-containing protein n=1 Tax=Dryococelus australis TaxID=614101 RepID=A0ABQ9HTQ6_9NEOP|nr:hypothetical protein PR048_013834 [Dryococelus australis]